MRADRSKTDGGFRRAPRCCGALLWLGLGGAAWAQAAPASPGQQDLCTSDERCSALFESARSLSRAGQLSAALDAYLAAYQRAPAPWLLINIGRVQQKLGKTDEAIRSYQRFLALPGSDADAELSARAREYLAQAQADAARQAAPRQAPVLAPSARSVLPLQSAPSAPLALGGTRASPPRRAAPLYRRWWFWTALAGGVAAAGAGIGVALAGHGAAPKNPPLPSGVSVYEPTF